MIPIYTKDLKPTKKQTRDHIRNLKQNRHLLSGADLKKAKQEIAAYEAEQNPAVEPAEHTLYYTASSRMLKDEKDYFDRTREENFLIKCPVAVEHLVGGKARHATIAHEDMEDLIDWLEHYGCNWQEQ